MLKLSSFQLKKLTRFFSNKNIQKLIHWNEFQLGSVFSPLDLKVLWFSITKANADFNSKRRKFFRVRRALLFLVANASIVQYEESLLINCCFDSTSAFCSKDRQITHIYCSVTSSTVDVRQTNLLLKYKNLTSSLYLIFQCKNTESFF